MAKRFYKDRTEKLYSCTAYSCKRTQLFYLLSIYRPIGSFLLGHELFSSRSSKALEFSIGNIIPASSFQNRDLKPKQYVRLFRKYLYRISKGRSGLLTTEKSISHHAERQILRKEIREGERLGTTRDGKDIFLIDPETSSTVLKEIGRLREYTFRKIEKGKGTRRDLHRYDAYTICILSCGIRRPWK